MMDFCYSILFHKIIFQPKLLFYWWQKKVPVHILSYLRQFHENLELKIKCHCTERIFGYMIIYWDSPSWWHYRRLKGPGMFCWLLWHLKTPLISEQEFCGYYYNNNGDLGRRAVDKQKGTKSNNVCTVTKPGRFGIWFNPMEQTYPTLLSKR